MRTIGAGFSYFICVFAIGFVLGPLRVLWLEPALGELPAVAIEAPIMLLAMFAAGRLIVRGFRLQQKWRGLVVTGVIAVTLVVIADFSVGLWLRDLSVVDQLARFATPAGILYGLLLLALAAMPGFASMQRAS